MTMETFEDKIVPILSAVLDEYERLSILTEDSGVSLRDFDSSAWVEAKRWVDLVTDPENDPHQWSDKPRLFYQSEALKAFRNALKPFAEMYIQNMHGRLEGDAPVISWWDKEDKRHFLCAADFKETWVTLGSWPLDVQLTDGEL